MQRDFIADPLCGAFSENKKARPVQAHQKARFGKRVGATIVAAALVIGGVVLVIQSRNAPCEHPAPPDISHSESVGSEDNSDHPHVFDIWAFDDEAHFLLCRCGVFHPERGAHTYVDGQCSICRKIEPLPSGNPYLTYDCTVLGGHWIYITGNASGGDVQSDFYISGDGSIYVQSKTYYPVGSRLGDAAMGEAAPMMIFFRETPYDPEVGITETEAYNTPIILEIQSVNDIGVIALSIINSENHVDSFYGQFYRESDYFGHEKNALDSATDYIFIPKQ